MKRDLIIIGAGSVGGHVACNLEDYSSEYNLLGFLDDDKSKTCKDFVGYPVLGRIDSIINYSTTISIVIGIAFPSIKLKIVERLSYLGYNNFPTLVSKAAWLSENTKIGKGCIIYPGTTINYNCTIQDFVFIREGNKVGMGGLSNISTTDLNCELYMYIDVNYQGKGLGYLSGEELCKFAFNTLKLEKVFLYTFSENYRANKLYEKIGFKLEGVLRKHTYKNERLQDRNIYGLLKNEFK